MSGLVQAETSPRESSRSPSPAKKTVIETRRAEQNRAAQRAFRQRKERYVKELESKVNAMADWPVRMELLEKENESLKRTIAELLSQQEEEDEERQANKKRLFAKESTPKPTSPPQTQPPLTPPTLPSNYTSPPPPLGSTTTSGKSVTGEKGRVLDDLVSILRTRHRPPIPSHPQNQEI